MEARSPWPNFLGTQFPVTMMAGDIEYGFQNTKNGNTWDRVVWNG